jgi:hypothetical protein
MLFRQRGISGELMLNCLETFRLYICMLFDFSISFNKFSTDLITCGQAFIFSRYSVSFEFM